MSKTSESTAYERRTFLAEVRAIGPESTAADIHAVLAKLRGDSKAQMGKLYLARQAKLHGIHMADYYLPRFTTETWQPRAYRGAAFYAEPTEPHSEMVKRRLEHQQHMLESAVRTSVEHQFGARATVFDVWPEALEPGHGVITIVPPEHIPLDSAQQAALNEGFRRYEATARHLYDIGVRLREAITTFDGQFTIMQMMRARQRTLLGATLSRTQDAYRQLEGVWHRIQREVYAVSLGMPTEKPGAIMDANRATACFAELSHVMGQIRANLGYLKIGL